MKKDSNGSDKAMSRPTQQDAAKWLHEEYLLLQAVVELTKAMCDCMGADDLPRLAELLQERERLLQKMMELRERVAPVVQKWGNRREVNARFIPLLEAIQNSNEKLLELLRIKKEEVFEKLKETQKQKRLLTYLK